MNRLSASEWDEWADVFDFAWQHPQTTASLKCPNCATVGELHLLYVLEEVDASHGMYAFWCSACLVGFPPGIGPVPLGAPRVRRGDEDVPDYRLAVDT